MSNLRQPALFLGHGSPMTTITDNPERRALVELGRRLRDRVKPGAILCISAHWETRGHIHLTSGARPRTIHDFRGFPPELYAMRYATPGSDWLEHRAAALLGPEGTLADPSWGFDHGTWGVLQPMFPEGDIPVVAMSLDRGLTPKAHLDAAAALAPLRDEGVLIVGSGNVIHNLAEWRASQGTVPDWADQFRTRVNAAVAAGDTAALVGFKPNDDAATRAINSGEHYLPLLYAAGARLPGDEVLAFNDTIDGALSMTSYFIGDPSLIAAPEPELTS